MSKKEALKQDLKKEKATVRKEISSLKKLISDYKAESKANWKLFKKKINDSIKKIEKPIDKLVAQRKK